MEESRYPFILPPLPYEYDALQPQLDCRTLYFHHDKHFATYVENLNKLLVEQPSWQSYTLEELSQNPTIDLPLEVRNNAGGVYSHDLYFKLLRPAPSAAPAAILQRAVDQTFGGLQELKRSLRTAAMDQFGSGWSWLALSPEGELVVYRSANQDTPPMPVLCCDVWEHAYYLQYQNRREEYFENWWQLVDWPQVSKRYANLLTQLPHSQE